MTEIPELPDYYTSDPQLMPFLKLLIQGLSDNRWDRPCIDDYQKHPFLQVAQGIYAGRDVQECEYLYIM